MVLDRIITHRRPSADDWRVTRKLIMKFGAVSY